MTGLVKNNLKLFCIDRSPGGRYASFDYCFNYFQGVRERGEAEQLLDEANLQMSCLQLGYYLASWGMMRGSGQLLQRSLRGLVPVVEVIAREPASTWQLDVPAYEQNLDDVLGLCDRIQRAFSFPATDTLVTKTVLGVFGCVPAFDRYFQIGFHCSSLSRRVLKRISQFYTDQEELLGTFNIRTLDFHSGKDTNRRYPIAKLIDMVFFQKGLNDSRGGNSRSSQV